MRKQPAFPGLRHAMKKKQTRREKFLAEMEEVVPWTRLLALIEPHYPKRGARGGRPPMPLQTMLRVYFLQQWYAHTHDHSLRFVTFIFINTYIFIT